MENRLELIIDYKDALTPKQVAVFYDGLYQILNEMEIANGVDFVIEKSSLKTIMQFRPCVVTILMHSSLFLAGQIEAEVYNVVKDRIVQTYTSPQTPIQKKVQRDLVEEYNNPNCRNISISINGNDNIVMLNGKEIEKRAQELNNNTDDKNKQEDVMSVEMIIETGKSIETFANKKGSISESHTFKYTAKFNDQRYTNIKYKIPFSSDDERFHQLNLKQVHTYSFIADGILHKKGGKYVKFEIQSLIDLEQAQLGSAQPELSLSQK